MPKIESLEHQDCQDASLLTIKTFSIVETDFKKCKDRESGSRQGF